MQVESACDQIAKHVEAVWQLKPGKYSVGHTQGVSPSVIYLYLSKKDLKRFAKAELPDVGHPVERKVGMPAKLA